MRVYVCYAMSASKWCNKHIPNMKTESKIMESTHHILLNDRAASFGYCCCCCYYCVAHIWNEISKEDTLDGRVEWCTTHCETHKYPSTFCEHHFIQHLPVHTHCCCYIYRGHKKTHTESFEQMRLCLCMCLCMLRTGGTFYRILHIIVQMATSFTIPNGGNVCYEL